MMVRQARDAGTEHDVPRALGSCRDHELGRRDQLPPSGVMLADPGLVIAQVVEPLDQFHVSGQRQRRILAHAMERSKEDAEFHSGMSHGTSWRDVTIRTARGPIHVTPTRARAATESSSARLRLGAAKE